MINSEPMETRVCPHCKSLITLPKMISFSMCGCGTVLVDTTIKQETK